MSISKHYSFIRNTTLISLNDDTLIKNVYYGNHNIEDRFGDTFMNVTTCLIKISSITL